MSPRRTILLAIIGLLVVTGHHAASEPPRTDDVGDTLPAGVLQRLGSTRLRPGGTVQHLAFSPDGTKLASWSQEMYVTDALAIWDTRTGRLLRRVDLPGARMKALTWLADGRGMAVLDSRDAAGSVHLWQFTDEKVTPQLTPPEGFGRVAAGGPVVDNEMDTCYAISPDGKTIAVGRAGQKDKPRAILLFPLKAGLSRIDWPEPKEL